MGELNYQMNEELKHYGVYTSNNFLMRVALLLLQDSQGGDDIFVIMDYEVFKNREYL